MALVAPGAPDVVFDDAPAPELHTPAIAISVTKANVQRTALRIRAIDRIVIPPQTPANAGEGTPMVPVMAIAYSRMV